jgi:hypothetical protein
MASATTSSLASRQQTTARFVPMPGSSTSLQNASSLHTRLFIDFPPRMTDRLQGSASQLTLLEEAAGSVFGFDDTIPGVPRQSAFDDPRTALESIVSGVLREGSPCLVSFSGGRDSSAVLAIAAHVSRRLGLPLPIPVSLVFPESTTAGESEYQEMVVRYLDLPDWQRLRFDAELDVIGPIAKTYLRKFGVGWPFNTFFHVPIMELSPGGTVLTGIGGDQIFAGWTWERENRVVSARERPLPLDWVRLPVSVGPESLRRRFLALRYRDASKRSWLRPAAGAAVRFEMLSISARESLSFARSIRNGLWRRRSRVLGLQSLANLAMSMDVRCESPFYHPDFVRAVTVSQGFHGFPNRTEAMADLVGDLLPRDLISRKSKASFADVFFNRHSRAFASGWTDAGVDSSLVDTVELARIWRDEDSLPDARTFTMLQAAWLRSTSVDE